MATRDGTDGLVHTIHVGREDDDGSLSDIREYENVVDAMNLPDGTVKFNHENGLKEFSQSRIVRVTVRGLEDACRYRCAECEDSESDVISKVDRGPNTEMRCPVCSTHTVHEQMGIDEI